MDQSEFVVTLLSVGKIAALRDPVNPAVYQAHAALREAVARTIGEDSERMLFEALAGMPEDDIGWLRRFVRVIGMADDPPIYAACLLLAGTIVVWAATLGAEQIFPYQLHLDALKNRVTVTGGEADLSLDLEGRLRAPDASAPAVFNDLGRLTDTIILGRLLPGDLNVESGFLSAPDDLMQPSDAADVEALSAVT